MKFHLPSYLLGILTAVVARKAGERLRPVAVEAAAVVSVLWTSARSVAEQQRETMEDLWAEVQERVRDRMTSKPSGHENGKGRTSEVV